MDLYWIVLKVTIREYLSEINIWKTLISILISLVFSFFLCKRKKIGVRLIALIYFVLVLIITVFGRKWFVSTSSVIGLFNTYRVLLAGSNPYEKYEVINNILLFIPAGIIIATQKETLFKKLVVQVFAISLAIELLQLITGSGLFEICDLIDNTLGGIIGIGLVVLFRKVKLKLIKQKSCEGD